MKHSIFATIFSAVCYTGAAIIVLLWAVYLFTAYAA